MDYGFTSINKQRVKSSDGFVVQFTGRFSLEYRDGSFVLQCGVEPGTPCETIEVPKLPFGNLTPDVRAEIVRRISAALDFLGVEYVID
jgi:hypothetical protein